MPAAVCLQIQTSFQPKGHLFTPTGLFSNGNQLLNIRSEIKTQESGKYLNWKQYLKPNSNFIFQFFYNSVLSKSCINGCCCLIFFLKTCRILSIVVVVLLLLIGSCCPHDLPGYHRQPYPTAPERCWRNCKNLVSNLLFQHSTELETFLINIARGTTDPGYWLFNLSYLYS